MRRRLHVNHVGVIAGTTYIVTTNPIVIIRIFTQAGHVAAGNVTNVQILISAYIAGK